MLPWRSLWEGKFHHQAVVLLHPHHASPPLSPTVLGFQLPNDRPLIVTGVRLSHGNPFVRFSALLNRATGAAGSTILTRARRGLALEPATRRKNSHGTYFGIQSAVFLRP